MIGDEEVDVYDLAKEIVDHLRPRSGASMAAIREWQERHRAEQLAEAAARLDAISALIQKSRIRVRAATQHAA